MSLDAKTLANALIGRLTLDFLISKAFLSFFTEPRS